MTQMQVRKALSANIRRRIPSKKCGIHGVNQLADVAGVSRSQLYDVLGSRKGASVDWIDKVAAVLNVDSFKLLQPN